MRDLGPRDLARNRAPEIEERFDESGSDSEDDDYIQSDSEEAEDDYEADIGDFIEEETEIDCLHDDIPDKQFEDYLDVSSTMDKTYRNGKIWTYQEFGAIRHEPWLIFGDRESFMEVFKDYCIQEGFGVYVDKTDKTRYISRCALDGCNWRIHASTIIDKVSWPIKNWKGEHRSCGRLEINPAVTSEWLCRHLQSDILANPDIPIESLQRLYMERFRIEVKKRLFYKVKAMCKERIHGGFGEAYSLLPKYADMVKETNPSSYALVSWDESNANEPPRFKAFGIDGNNEIFLIAYGVVGTESIDSWAIHDTFPRATRRVCCQHLYTNCKAKGFSSSAFHKLFWIAADAYNEYVFINKAMKKILEYNPKAVEYLESCTKV
ncbi:uncharacterized protein LOC110713483 [Chenopodium quinoa]|uniref:uncharacterized protein LOC110713483 n=1 Tax=Chenopodium quinoa TaxID=63459 RepID=UPI000B77E7FD|nr:uncharacterized protein LOC110713483 [Chenopodium quinoa]